MPFPNQPAKAIVVVLAQPEEGPVEFLGTGFFIDQDGTFLTAKHVLADYGLDRRSEFQISMRRGKEGYGRHQVTGVVVSNRFDIALAKAIDVADVFPLELADKEVGGNQDVLTVDYSGTTQQPPREGSGLNILSYTRKGNVLCQRVSDYPGPEPASILDLSFPALKGSSGAPVIVDQTGAVVGMILANVGQQLLPAHIERTEYPGGEAEEIKYFLPQGIAIHWSHLREFAASVRP